MNNYQTVSILLISLFFAADLYGGVGPIDTDGDGSRNINSIEHLEWLFERPEYWEQDFELDGDIDAIASKDLNGGKGIVFPEGRPNEIFLNINYNDYSIKNLFFWDNKGKRTFRISESLGPSPINRSKQREEPSTEIKEISRKYKYAVTANYGGLTPVVGASVHFFLVEHVKLSFGVGMPSVGCQVDYMFRNTSKYRNNFSIGAIGFGTLESAMFDDSSEILAGAALVGGYHFSSEALFLSVHLGVLKLNTSYYNLIPYGGFSLGFRF